MAKPYIRNQTKFIGVYYINSITNNKPDKTFYIRYKDENSKDKELKIGKYSEGIRENYCYTKRNEIVTKIRLGEDLPKVAARNYKTSFTLDDISKLYFEYREVHHNKKSKNNEEYRYNTHLKPIFGKMYLDTIATQDIEKLQREKLKTHAPKTVNHILTLFSTIFNYSINNDIYKGNNPLNKIKRLKINNRRERFLTLNEIQLLLDNVRDNELLYLFCLIAFSTGARATTILNIKKKHINIQERNITLTDFKNSTTYTGFITKEIVIILNEKLKTLSINEYIFQINNSQAKLREMQKRLKPILDELFNEGLEKDDAKNRVVIHTFRHSFASNLAIKGTPIYTIQKLLNHKDINMTLRYAKLSPDSGKDMVDNIMKNLI
ncbi:MAG: tyrosine-type recombinase/integrase [Aliarcobacter sp.]|nr:tyrosine-type recombinase/integrase [Aliarcobacter sp.]